MVEDPILEIIPPTRIFMKADYENSDNWFHKVCKHLSDAVRSYIFGRISGAKSKSRSRICTK